MIATGKRSTVKPSHRYIQGVLFLTAGYGTRAEPLSFFRPKALLPWGYSTLMGNLVRQFAAVDPESMVFNASRCPELVMQEAENNWSGMTRLLFEERPLGAPGTLGKNCGLFQGHWIVTNTDMVLDVPVREMIDFHLGTGSKWTVLTGDFPGYGNYSPLYVNGKPRHYLGVSIISQEIAEIAAGEQLGTGFFSLLRKAAEKEGIVIREFFSRTKWLDMGEVNLFRKHLLSKGSYIHPSADIYDGANLQGVYWIGSSCNILPGASVRDSVMLEGSTLSSGSQLIDGVLPWFSRRS